MNQLIEEINKKAINFGLSIRLVEIKDAECILKLRTNTMLSRHIHKTEYNLAKQIDYINDYKAKEFCELEYYFAFSIIGVEEPIGFYRVHNINKINRSFSIGSWIFDLNSPEGKPIIADILSKEFGFELLGLEICYFDVRRNNKNVYRYHMQFCPKFINIDDEENMFFYLSKENFEANKENILKHYR